MELRLQELRKQRRMTQAELGKAVGVSMRVVSGWERGETDITLIDAARVADVLECTLDELIGRDFPNACAARLTAEERELVDLYRDTDERGQRSILSAAIGQRDEFSRGGATEEKRFKNGIA